MLDTSVARIDIKLRVQGKDEALGELIRFLAPRTVEGILQKLPHEGRAFLLKDGVYFALPLKIGFEKARKNVEAGTLAYWPLATAFCIFYSKTQTYSPVNVVGRITNNLHIFQKIVDGTRIKIALRARGK
ncbi:MAG: hypothetical protein JSV20_03345 [Candidatus Bathyarchaeota archaeon]|nr:MAG: hypothetical protein JSV20_03345 [Candidatus Bathyarchaeota archaeon]